MFTIGLTGNIGTGKSTVAGMLKELGARLIDADKLGHIVLAGDAGIKRELVSSIGSGILDSHGNIDRKKLGEIVFSNPESLALLNRLMHDRIKALTLSGTEEACKAGVKVLVLEVPLLFEAGWEKMVDEVWVTHAPEDIILERITKRDKASREDVMARLRSQMPQAEKIKRSDVAIDTSITLAELKNKIIDLYRSRLRKNT